jgi:glycosyltransferase involved in cell wall biosynthesis
LQKNLAQFSTQVLIAALNEEQGIGPTITEFTKTLKTRFLVVDGNSRDATPEIAKKLGAQVLYQEGTGKGDAIMKGLKHLHPETEYVIFTDADFTYPASSVLRMLSILKNNPEVGMVCGNRFSGQTDDNAFYGSFSTGNRLLASAHKLLNGVLLDDPLTGLRVVRANLLRKWKVKSKGFDIEVELNHQVKRQRLKTVEIPIRYRDRIGKKKLRIKDGIPILKRIILEFIHTIIEYL